MSPSPFDCVSTQMNGTGSGCAIITVDGGEGVWGMHGAVLGFFYPMQLYDVTLLYPPFADML